MKTITTDKEFNIFKENRKKKRERNKRKKQLKTNLITKTIKQNANN